MPIVKEKRNVLASLPKVDVFLSRSDMSALADSYSPLLVKDALQKVLATIREDVLNKKITDVPADEEVAALGSKIERPFACAASLTRQVRCCIRIWDVPY